MILTVKVQDYHKPEMQTQNHLIDLPSVEYPVIMEAKTISFICSLDQSLDICAYTDKPQNFCYTQSSAK